MTAAAPRSEWKDWADPRWRLSNIYTITTDEGVAVPFRMNWAQEALFADMHNLSLILKARQLGFTTFIQLYMLDQCLFNDNKQAGTIAHTLADAIKIFVTKVKFPYEHLPEQLLAQRPPLEDSARSLSFPNGSRISVGTSMRSGTLQYLHISEYGKLCARFPEKAREVRTGALNTLAAGQIGFIESTAEGQEGDFFRRCEESQAAQRRGDTLTEMDWKFSFFPWWRHPKYILNPEGVILTAEEDKYFGELEALGIELTPAQKVWYSKKSADQDQDMKREFPSTPEEAFEAAIEGAYYGDLLTKVEKDGRMCELPVETVATETWWDLGMNDMMSIWWVQRVGAWLHIIDYYEDSGEGLAHYASILQEKQKERGLIYGDHYWPHDGNVRVLDEKGRKRTEIMTGLGYEPEVVPRGSVADGIQSVRTLLQKCRFDVKRTAKGIAALKGYRKEWKEDLGTWGRQPLHNWASNGADAFRTGAMHTPTTKREGTKRRKLGNIV